MTGVLKNKISDNDGCVMRDEFDERVKGIVCRNKGKKKKKIGKRVGR
ncbi:hypothetical protein IF1G_06393 [Cordyceps javanica]|uniref:Uncharacterized protein n=1 Tax=Cordyceps javanica TaxID=43265 RepID=A0A545V119_9HYPO|nr:hypothetical protein IF1G_06393 [Cordyceps javanica]